MSHMASEHTGGDEYLVWSHEHGAWWRANRCGYTVHVRAAGRYSHSEALDICLHSRNGWQNECAPYEIPVRLADAEHLTAAIALTAGKTG